MSKPNEVTENYKSKLIALMNGLEVQNIEEAIELDSTTIARIGNAIATELKAHQASKTEWVSESVDRLFNRLQIEAMQYQEIRASTQDGDLACICATHEMDIYKLLNEVKPLKRVDCEGVGDNDGFFELSTPPKMEE